MSATATPITDPTSAKPPRPRRWIPLALKIFTVILLLLGFVGGTWFGVRHHQISSILEEVKRAGGRCEVRPGGPAWLRKLLGDNLMLASDEITAVHLGNSKANDEQLVPLQKLTTLQKLELRETKVTDAGLISLKGLTNLQELGLEVTQITDDGLTDLKDFPKLEYLQLSGNKITDVPAAPAAHAPHRSD